MESGSCNWRSNNKKAPTVQQPLGVRQKDVLPPATARLQTRASRRMCQLPVTVCTTDGQRAALFVGPGLPPRPTAFPDPSVYCKKWQPDRSQAPVFRSVCRVNGLYFPPLQKKNMLSQLARVTRIPNRPCMYVGRRSMLAAAGGLIVSAPHLLASITFCRRCNIRVEGLQQHMRL